MMGFLVISLVVVVVFGWFFGSSMRAMSRQFDQRSRSIDQDMVEARLHRIEEAIDAMALQIERLTEQQRALLVGPRAGEQLTREPPPERRE
jgi:hypothetical protein